MKTRKQKHVGQFQVRQPFIHPNCRPPRNKSASAPKKSIWRGVVRRVANWTTGFKPNGNFRPAIILFPPIEAMSYYIISTDNCVFLTCEGISSLDEMTAAWREVRDELAEKSLNRVLVDVTALQTSPTTAELFDLAKLFWHDGFPASSDGLHLWFGGINRGQPNRLKCWFGLSGCG